MIDAGLLLGRSFRVGWGPNGHLVHPGEWADKFPYKLCCLPGALLQRQGYFRDVFQPSSVRTRSS